MEGEREERERVDEGECEGKGNHILEEGAADSEEKERTGAKAAPSLTEAEYRAKQKRRWAAKRAEFARTRLRVVAKSASKPLSVDEMKAVFDELDRDGKGLTHAEVRQALEGLQIRSSEDEVHELFAIIRGTTQRVYEQQLEYDDVSYGDDELASDDFADDENLARTYDRRRFNVERAREHLRRRRWRRRIDDDDKDALQVDDLDDDRIASRVVDDDEDDKDDGDDLARQQQQLQALGRKRREQKRRFLSNGRAAPRSHSGAAAERLERQERMAREVISFEQFVWFVAQREAKLRAIFEDLDLDGSGWLEPPEVALALHNMGLDSSPVEIEAMLRRADSDGDGRVSYAEFRELTLLFPSVEVKRLFDRWRDGSVDIGETSYAVPDDDTGDAMVPWKRVVLAGGVAGAVSRTVTAPFDRLKVVLQAGTPINGKPVTGIVAGLRAIYIEGGLRAFFRGNGTNVLKITPESAVRWFAFETMMSVLVGSSSPDELSKAGVHHRFFAGACAGVAAQAAIYPLEVTKTRLAVSPPGAYNGIADCIAKTLRADGPRGLFRGMAPSLAGIVPYAGVDMGVYFTIKAAWLRRHPHEESPNTLTILAMGAGSSICGQVIAYPLQLIRTKLQTQGSAGYRGPAYSGVVDCATQVFREHGVKGFYRGIGPNFLKAVPAISVSYAVYERMKDFLGLA
jgi:solute carrier family 25 (mitochondrial phosphate transporter), member 23/24/25/41